MSTMSNVDIKLNVKTGDLTGITSLKNIFTDVKTNAGTALGAMKTLVEKGNLLKIPVGLDKLAVALGKIKDVPQTPNLLGFSKALEKIEKINLSQLEDQVAIIAPQLKKLTGIKSKGILDLSVGLKVMMDTKFKGFASKILTIHTNLVKLEGISATKIKNLTLALDGFIKLGLSELGTNLGLVFKGLNKLQGLKVVNITAFVKALKMLASAEEIPLSGFAMRMSTVVKQLKRLKKIKVPNILSLARGLKVLSGVDVGIVADKIKKLNTALKKLKKAGQLKAFSNFAKDLKNLGGALEKAIGASNKAKKSFSSLNTTMNQAGQSAGFLGMKLQNFLQYRVISIIFQEITQSLMTGIHAIMGYDQALKSLQAITGATGLEVEQIGTKILDVASKTKFAASEVSQGMIILGQAGFTASEAIGVIQSVSDLATGTLSSMSETVDLFTSVMRVFNLEASRAAEVADTFANAINKSKLTIDKLRTSIQYVGPIAKESGIGFGELAASMMVLANSGLRSSKIGTGLRRVFAELISPTEKLSQAVYKAGLNMSDLDPRFNSLSEVLFNLNLVVTDTDMAFELFGKRGAAAALSLTKNPEAFNTMIGHVQKTGTAAAMAAKQMEGLQVSFKNLIDKVKNFAIAIGEAGLGDILRILIDRLRNFADALTWIASNGFVKIILQVTMLTTVLVALTASVYGLSILISTKFKMALGWVLVKIASTTASMIAVSTATGTATGAALNLSAAMTTLKFAMGWLVGIISVVVSLTWVFSKWATHTKEAAMEAAKLSDVYFTMQERMKNYHSNLIGLSKDSGEYADKNKSLRKELLEAAKSMGEVSVEARAAALSIDPLTGAIIDDGEALKEWNKQLQTVSFNKIIEASVKTNKQFDKSVGFWRTRIDMTWDMLKGASPSGDFEFFNISKGIKKGTISLKELEKIIASWDSSNLNDQQKTIVENFAFLQEQSTKFKDALLASGKISLSQTIEQIEQIAESTGVSGRILESMLNQVQIIQDQSSKAILTSMDKWKKEISQGRVFSTYYNDYESLRKLLTEGQRKVLSGFENEKKAIVAVGEALKKARDTSLSGTTDKQEQKQIWEQYFEDVAKLEIKSAELRKKISRNTEHQIVEDIHNAEAKKEIAYAKADSLHRNTSDNSIKNVKALVTAYSQADKEYEKMMKKAVLQYEKPKDIHAGTKEKISILKESFAKEQELLEILFLNKELSEGKYLIKKRQLNIEESANIVAVWKKANDQIIKQDDQKLPESQKVMAKYRAAQVADGKLKVRIAKEIDEQLINIKENYFEEQVRLNQEGEGNIISETEQQAQDIYMIQKSSLEKRLQVEKEMLSKMTSAGFEEQEKQKTKVSEVQIAITNLTKKETDRRIEYLQEQHKESISLEEDYANKIKSLRNELSSTEETFADKRRKIQRETMSDVEKQADIEKEIYKKLKSARNNAAKAEELGDLALKSQGEEKEKLLKQQEELNKKSKQQVNSVLNLNDSLKDQGKKLEILNQAERIRKDQILESISTYEELKIAQENQTNVLVEGIKTVSKEMKELNSTLSKLSTGLDISINIPDNEINKLNSLKENILDINNVLEKDIDIDVKSIDKVVDKTENLIKELQNQKFDLISEKKVDDVTNKFKTIGETVPLVVEVLGKTSSGESGVPVLDALETLKKELDSLKGIDFPIIINFEGLKESFLASNGEATEAIKNSLNFDSVFEQIKNEFEIDLSWMSKDVERAIISVFSNMDLQTLAELDLSKIDFSFLLDTETLESGFLGIVDKIKEAIQSVSSVDFSFINIDEGKTLKTLAQLPKVFQEINKQVSQMDFSSSFQFFDKIHDFFSWGADDVFKKLSKETDTFVSLMESGNVSIEMLYDFIKQIDAVKIKHLPIQTQKLKEEFLKANLESDLLVQSLMKIGVLDFSITVNEINAIAEANSNSAMTAELLKEKLLEIQSVGAKDFSSDSLNLEKEIKLSRENLKTLQEIKKIRKSDLETIKSHFLLMEMLKGKYQEIETERDRSLSKAGTDVKKRTSIWNDYYINKSELDKKTIKLSKKREDDLLFYQLNLIKEVNSQRLQEEEDVNKKYVANAIIRERKIAEIAIKYNQQIREIQFKYVKFYLDLAEKKEKEAVKLSSLSLLELQAGRKGDLVSQEKYLKEKLKQETDLKKKIAETWKETFENISTSYRGNVEDRKQIEKEYYEAVIDYNESIFSQKKQLQEKLFGLQKKLFDSNNQILQAGLDKELMSIAELENKKTITEKEAIQKRYDLTLGLYRDKLNAAKAYYNAVDAEEDPDESSERYDILLAVEKDYLNKKRSLLEENTKMTRDAEKEMRDIGKKTVNEREKTAKKMEDIENDLIGDMKDLQEDYHNKKVSQEKKHSITLEKLGRDLASKLKGFAEKRVEIEEKIADKIKDINKKLAKKISDINKKMEDERQKTAWNLIGIEESITDEIRHIKQDELSDEAKLLDQKKEAYEKLAQAREQIDIASKAGDEVGLEKGKAYAEQARSLVSSLEKQATKIDILKKVQIELLRAEDSIGQIKLLDLRLDKEDERTESIKEQTQAQRDLNKEQEKVDDDEKDARTDYASKVKVEQDLYRQRVIDREKEKVRAIDDILEIAVKQSNEETARHTEVMSNLQIEKEKYEEILETAKLIQKNLDWDLKIGEETSPVKQDKILKDIEEAKKAKLELSKIDLISPEQIIKSSAGVKKFTDIFLNFRTRFSKLTTLQLFDLKEFGDIKKETKKIVKELNKGNISFSKFAEFIDHVKDVEFTNLPFQTRRLIKEFKNAQVDAEKLTKELLVLGKVKLTDSVYDIVQIAKKSTESALVIELLKKKFQELKKEGGKVEIDINSDSAGLAQTKTEIKSLAKESKVAMAGMIPTESVSNFFNKAMVETKDFAKKAGDILSDVFLVSEATAAPFKGIEKGFEKLNTVSKKFVGFELIPQEKIESAKQGLNSFVGKIEEVGTAIKKVAKEELLSSEQEKNAQKILSSVLKRTKKIDEGFKKAGSEMPLSDFKKMSEKVSEALKSSQDNIYMWVEQTEKGLVRHFNNMGHEGAIELTDSLVETLGNKRKTIGDNFNLEDDFVGDFKQLGGKISDSLKPIELKVKKTFTEIGDQAGKVMGNSLISSQQINKQKIIQASDISNEMKKSGKKAGESFSEGIKQNNFLEEFQVQIKAFEAGLGSMTFKNPIESMEDIVVRNIEELENYYNKLKSGVPIYEDFDKTLENSINKMSGMENLKGLDPKFIEQYLQALKNSNKELEELEKKKINIPIETDLEKAEEEVRVWRNDLFDDDRLQKMKVGVELDDKELQKLQTEMDLLEDKDVTTTAKVKGMSLLEKLKDMIGKIKDKVVTITTKYVSQGKKPEGRRIGGRIPGYGGGDKYPILAEGGEWFIRKEAVKKYGDNFINAINNMSLPIRGFKTGGAVSGLLSKPSFRQPAVATDSFQGFADFGKLNINTGTVKFPTLIHKDIVSELQVHMKRSRLMGAN